MTFDIAEIVTDTRALQKGYVCRDGYVFTASQHHPPVYDKLLVRVPDDAWCRRRNVGFSYRSLAEHAAFANDYPVRKLCILCSDLKFIHQFPKSDDLEIWPTEEAGDDFDYSPLYEHPNLRALTCHTVYGEQEQYKTTIDYSKIKGLEEINMVGAGHLGYNEVPSLRTLWMSGNKGLKTCESLSNSPVLSDVTLFGCGIRSLQGLEAHPQIEKLTLWHDYSLGDISALEALPVLKRLDINACSKIKDFSVLEKLPHLEQLHLSGNNRLPDLAFLNNMPHLKVFSFTMNVESGDLRPCLSVPFVTCQNRRHYNLKDAQLPKNLL